MSKKLWGGRFEKATDPLVEKFTKSIQYDYKLAQYDLVGSMLHIFVLQKAGILTSNEASKLTEALKEINETIKNNKFRFDPNSEDIHTQIQNMLQKNKNIGDLALKLHTARSRNDQVVFATKCYIKAGIFKLRKLILSLTGSILEVEKQNIDIILPGFTHMQHAQPVLLANYLGAYFWMLHRDVNRLSYIEEHMMVTMGAGALAGTPIDAVNYNMKVSEVVKEIGEFAKHFKIEPASNSIDAVSDRDFVIEILSALSIIGMHLSRLAEDLILWSTKEFDFIEIDESFCTGSSLMPQKKNPDVLELIRGYSGRLNGNLVNVLTMMKGLPLTYNRDMQLDKEPLFDSFEIVSRELEVLAKLIKTMKFNKDKIREHLKDESLYATDLVYYLVIKKGIAFKTAHNIVGKLVKDSSGRVGGIQGMPEKDLKRYCNKFVKKEIAELFKAEVSVESKKSMAKVDITS